jgi:hypothetical protein
MKIFAASLLMLGFALLQGCCCPPGIGGFIPKDAERYFQGDKANEFEATSDADVCRVASDEGTKWHDSEALSAWVEEAKERNLTLYDCHKILFVVIK